MWIAAQEMTMSLSYVVFFLCLFLMIFFFYIPHLLILSYSESNPIYFMLREGVEQKKPFRSNNVAWWDVRQNVISAKNSYITDFEGFSHAPGIFFTIFFTNPTLVIRKLQNSNQRAASLVKCLCQKVYKKSKEVSIYYQ